MILFDSALIFTNSLTLPFTIGLLPKCTSSPHHNCQRRHQHWWEHQQQYDRKEALMPAARNGRKDSVVVYDVQVSDDTAQAPSIEVEEHRDSIGQIR